MPVQALKVPPGVQVQETPLLAEAAWVQSQLVRFKDGMLQKLGGWTQLIATALVGTCRGMFTWEDFAAVDYLILGTEQRLTVFTFGAFTDVTPIQQTDNLTNQLTSVNTSTTVSVADVGYTPSTGDWAQFVNPMSIGGINNIQGFFQVTNGGNPWTFTANSAATSGVSSGGTAVQYVTVNTSATVTVNFNGHGIANGGTYTPAISTIVGGLTFAPSSNYTITLVTANQFTINAGAPATSSTSGFENGGAAQINYLLPSGLVSATSQTGYGDNVYNLGLYGFGATSGSEKPLRQWFFGKWGDSVVCNPTGGAIYFWNSENGTINNPATLITQAPNVISGGIFVNGTAQQIVAMGAGPSPGLGDPMLVRWCDVSDFTVWTATVTNQAGSFRPSRGARMVGGLSAPQQNLLWTDVGLWSMQYLGFPLVYGFTEIGQGCGLISARAAGTLGEAILWMSQQQFFFYEGGAPLPIPCPVWDQVFGNINLQQVDKTLSAPNSYFNEMAWFYPSATGTGEVDSYVKVQLAGGNFIWDYGLLERTAWVDQTSFGPPMGVDGGGLVQQHEIATDNNGVSMSCSARTGWFKIADGDLMLFIERLLPDFKSLVGSPTLQLTVFTQNYGISGETLTYTYGPYTVTSSTRFVIVRARGRIASVQIASSDLGTSWRLGEILYYLAPAGKRF